MGTPSNQLLAKWRFTVVISAILLAANVFAQTGTLSYIKIVQGVAGNGPEILNITLTTDQTLAVHAAGFDAGNNYLGDVSVNWSLSGGVGILTPVAGVTTILETKTPGTSMLAADHPTAIDDISGLITVAVGAPYRVKVLSGVSGATPEVGNLTLASGQTLALHAGSFDADNNYVGDVSVTWRVSGGIGILSGPNGTATAFTAINAGVGLITADHLSLVDDTTGVIRVGTTGVESNSLNGTPQKFQLLQNYPNPFQANVTTTQILYELPENNSVKIAVYNVNGQVMQVLLNGQRNAGRYGATWDGKTAEGVSAPSGIYLVRLEAGRFSATQKIILTR